MHSLAAAFLLAAAGTLASGQDPAPAPRSDAGRETPPVFESGAELVRLDLVIRDGKGRFVRDLRGDEIRVLEDGQPVTLSSLRLVDADGRGPLRERPILVVGQAAEAGSAPAPAPAIAGEARPLTSVVVLLFDTPLQGRAAQAAQRAALDFVDRSFPQNTWFGVFKASRAGLLTLQPYTEDRRSLKLAIQEATRGADVVLDQTVDLAASAYGGASLADRSPGTVGSAAVMRSVMSSMADFESLLMRNERGRNSLYPLLALARSLRGVEGRKTLLHFSQGLEVTPDIEPLLLSAISESNRSNLAVYTLDARGLLIQAPYAETRSALRAAIPPQAFMGPTELATMQQSGGGSISRAEVFRLDRAADALRMNVQENLRELAEGTSGFLIANSNDLRPGLDLVARDLRTFYEMAYVPPRSEPDGTFHEIAVKVARKDVSVRVRKGYYALPAVAPVIHPWELTLVQALEGDVLPRGLGLRAGTVRFAPDLRASRAVALVEAPLGDLEARVDPQTGHWLAHVSMVGFVKDDHGKVLARLSQDWPLEGVGSPGGLRGRTVMLKRTVDLPPGRYTLEAAVQDRFSGRLGARRVPFLVPEASSGPVVGSVAVVRFRPVSPEGQDPDDPLLIREKRWEKATVQALPVLGAPLTVEAGRIGVLASVRADQNDGPMSVTVEFRRDGQLLAEASPEVPDPDATGQILVARSFALPSIEPGRYQVYVRVRQREKEASAGTSFQLERADPFSLLPGTLASRDTVF
jgi:VWFA-related protein